MTTCAGDNFTVSADVSYPDAVSLSGCYGPVSSLNGETQYFLDGDDDEGQPSIFASGYFDPDEYVWTLAYDEGGGYNYTCRDADENDATALVHPTNVAQWNCTEELGAFDFAVLDSMTATCGCGESTTTETSSSEQGESHRTCVEDTPVGAIAGGVVAGVLVIVAVILAVLFKTGRLKACRGSSSKTSADDVTPAPSSGPVPAGKARPQASQGPISQYPGRPQYPVAHQYPQAL
ncbi:unnamed protein product [Ectocarpus fasciculatus]